MKSDKTLGFLFLPIYFMLFAGISLLPRADFATLIGLFAACFAIYAFALARNFELKITYGILLFFAIRIPFYFDLPQLSDDFYRFLWDGMLLNHGLNPFSRIPVEQYMGNFDDPAFANLLLDKMNSSLYSSVYPTLHQMVFGLSYFFSGPKLLVGVNMMRSFIMIAEFLFIVFLLFRNQRVQRFGMYYLLNPLVVVEGVGNVHLEAILVPLLAASLIEFSPIRYLRSAVSWSAAILVKLTPLILSPLFFFKHAPRRRWHFFIAVFISLFIFMGMLEPWTVFNNLGKGLGLYYSSFEFNASVYYVLREILTPVFGYNPIMWLAPFLGLVSLILIVLLCAYRRNANIFEVSLIAYLIFLLLSTTVHPWYILPVVMLAIFAKRYYLLIWSFTVWFSYSHYVSDLGPKWALLFLEYAILAIAIGYEGWLRKWLQPELRG